jgi:hypothetical protein
MSTNSGLTLLRLIRLREFHGVGVVGKFRGPVFMSGLRNKHWRGQKTSPNKPLAQALGGVKPLEGSDLSLLTFE